MKNKFQKPNRIYIKALKLKNFKAFGNETDIELSPMINLIFGKNSTGKSSILQSLRLLRQSYGKDQLTPFNLESPEKYKDNGGIDIDIQYRGIITDNNEKEKLTLGIKTGILSYDNSEYLDADKQVIYEFKYDNKFYSSGNQLIKDKVLLNSLNITNRVQNVSYKLEFPKVNKFKDDSDIAYKLLSQVKFQRKEDFERDQNKYSSLYSPYYYNIKLKELNIENLEGLYKEFCKLKKEIIALFDKYSKSFNQKNVNDIKAVKIKEFDETFKIIKKVKNIKDDKKRIYELNKLSDRYAKYFVTSRLNFGLREYSKKELEELSDELKKSVIFLKKCKSFREFSSYIFSDCQKKVERAVYYMGRFFVNPEKRYDSYRSTQSRFGFLQDTVEDKVLYLYDFLSDAVDYYAHINKKDKFRVLSLLRAFTHNPRDQKESPGSVYNDLNICMEKMYVIPGLRSMPKRYFAKGIQTSYVGARAENLAETLANPSVRNDTNKWLKKLEIPYSVKVINVENHYEIIWQPRNKKINIFQNHIGLGYPLILPFIVQCLTAKNNIIVVEEPEVHLHPKLQADLGDLIVESSLKNDNQIILETHSEDLLLRVLKKIRSKEISSNFVSANYVLKEGNKPPEIKKIRISSEGQYFTPWKDDIFAERLKELA